jgi:NAD+ diphosphatase
MSVTRPSLGRAAIDRQAHRRTDPALDEQLAAVPALAVSTESLLVDATGEPMLIEPGASGLLLYLGHDGQQIHAALAVDPADAAAFASDHGGRWVNVRELAAGLSDADAGLAIHAIGLAQWHERHMFCARCGSQTKVTDGGHVRRCPTCAADHFPRTDPAVIMLVTDRDGRAVLGRGRTWPEGRRSVLAGFVEPGESAEAAVAREVAEEVGLTVRNITYVESQPWPFPASLMLAYTAEADGPLIVDESELAEADWYSREQALAAVADGSLVLSPPVSVSRRLIDGWLTGELGGGERGGSDGAVVSDGR